MNENGYYENKMLHCIQTMEKRKIEKLNTHQAGNGKLKASRPRSVAK